MSRFRRRIGESGCELILQATVTVGIKSKMVSRFQLRRVTVDTTLQEKAVSFPTDSKLLNRSRVRRMTGSAIEEAFVDRGYRGHGETQTTVYISGQRRGIKTQCLILRQLRIFCAQIWGSLWALLSSASHHDAAVSRDTSITGIAWQPTINCG